MIRESRQVGFKTFLGLLMQKRVPFIMGIVFTVLPLAMTIMFAIILNAGEPNIPDEDYDAISAKGNLTSATITDIETQSNITINNEHPSIISYKYMDGNHEQNGIYRSLDPDKISRLDIGDTIQIKYLGNGSMIVGLKTFEFPVDILATVLIPFAIAGIIILTVVYLGARKQVNLYKDGDIKDAEVVSIMQKAGLPISGVGQGVVVYYQYKNFRGENILSESFTSDYTMLTSKKQGDVIKIFVSPENESQSCLIPKLEAIRNNWRID